MGRLIRSSEFDGANNLIQRIEQLYDKANRLEQQSWVIDGDSYSESYTYNDPVVGADASVRPQDGSLASVTTATGDKILYTYESLKRLGGTTVENAAGEPLFRTGYSYKAGKETNQTTSQVLVYTTWNPNYSNILSYRYRYDAVGNIIKIEDVTNTARTLAEYTYDELNQLTQEKIYNYTGTSATPTSTDTYVYTYDTAGNILTEKKNGTTVNTYSYSTGPWTDQLVAVNGEEITYDGSGNPNIYVSGYGESYYMVGFDGRNWRGFQTLSDTRLQVAYDYDADGIRTAKCVDGEDHDYVTQNGKVVREIIEAGTTEKVLDFVYDNSGKPFALIYTNGTAEPETYYYVLNLQGDVVALITADCTIVAQYTYNAWGKLLSVTDEDGEAITSASHIANLNPIRYRGYYYDTETGFYYLQSRYYDPANHRFINADSYASTGQGFLGYNMFAYCNNNPVCLCDSSGHLASIIPLIIIGLALLTGCATQEEEAWPENAPLQYYPKGTKTTDPNCYAYVFGYPVCADPGFFYSGTDEYHILQRTEDYKLPDSYTTDNIKWIVEKDAQAMGRNVHHIDSPNDLSEGAWLVVCKLEADSDDYHFAVMPPGFGWFDKPGPSESRYGKLDAYSQKWKIGDHVYDSAPIYFEYIPG